MVKKNAASELVTKTFLEAHLELKLDKLKREIDENAKKYRDQILTRLDPIAAELENARLDRELGASQTSAIRETVEDHETRIVKLETP